jgi:hypothetical protein
MAAGGLALAMASCGGGRDVFPEAESLEKAGKYEEAAAKLDLVCPLAPAGPQCAEAGARAFEARMKAAEAEVGQGHFLAADRLVRQAMATGDEAARKRARERLAQEDLTSGIACERALAMTDRKKAAVALAPIAASKGPAAAKARAWLDTEGQAILVQAVLAACGPDHEGSCSESVAALKASGNKGPDVDAAARAVDAEQRRVAPLLKQAESFLHVFAAQAQKQLAFQKCQAEHTADGTDPAAVRGKCEEEAFGTDPDDKRYQAQKNNESLFRRLLKNIADPALAKSLAARKGAAQSFGEVYPASKPAPRSP